MKALMAGEQGRAWLTRGALRDAPIARRFDRYVDAMATDASRFVGQKTWRRFWGADNELVCLATKLRVAMVCVETATKTHGAFLAVPPDVAETSAARGVALDGVARFGRYFRDGAFETVKNSTVTVDHSRSTSRVKKEKCLRWRASRGAVTLTVRAARRGLESRRTRPSAAAAATIAKPFPLWSSCTGRGISTACSPRRGTCWSWSAK